ncbi:MAG: hypothetical protein GKR89_07315 [Candidatus Latescibacteria bacterium]|nr:hypothetical protein [Candidatus Latescibacterota bacterium]
MTAGAELWQRVEDVLECRVQMGLAATGGGSQLLTWLLNHPGASRAVVEAQVPYHGAALEAYLGGPGPHRVEEETARALAGRAHARVRGFVGDDLPSLGLGCTAALATNRQRRGQDRAHIAVRTSGHYHFWRLDFDKGAGDRLAQEDVVSRQALQGLTEACGLDPVLPELPAWARLKQGQMPVDEALESLLLGEEEAVEMGLDGVLRSNSKGPGRLLFPGSFNPFHQGHQQLAAAAAVQTGREVALELSVDNVDKPSLAYAEIARRLEPLKGQFPVVLSRAPTFLRKARLFADCIFVIGYDTAARLVERKYYEEGRMEEALDEIGQRGGRFAVAGRLHEGRYKTLGDVAVPAAYRPLFSAIPEAAFRQDISSTQIRASAQEEPPRD